MAEYEEDSLIDDDKLEQWLDARSDKLGDYVRSSGAKVKYLLNSMWSSDTKRHLALLPRRGKWGRYRDFKSGNNGSIVAFVMTVDGVSWNEAVGLVTDIGEIGVSGANVAENVREWNFSEGTVHKEIKKKSNLALPPGCIKIGSESCVYPRMSGAISYLQERCIDPDCYDAYLCTEDFHSKSGKTIRLPGMILFPYKDWNGNLVYWTARNISLASRVRYLDSMPDDGYMHKEDVLYCPDWSIHGKHVLVAEGPIDCMSVHACGIRCVASQGSVWYDGQERLLRDFGAKPVFAFDRDLAGMKATLQAARSWRGECHVVFAPDGCDWNKALASLGARGLNNHIMNSVLAWNETVENMIRSRVTWMESKKSNLRQKTSPTPRTF